MDMSIFPFWEHLNSEERALIESRARKVRFEEGRIISSMDMDCLGVLYVYSGVLRMYLYSEDGREVTVSRMAENELCLMTASCMFSMDSFSAQIAAESDVEALLIPIGTIVQLKEQNVYVENYVLSVMTGRFAEILSAVEQLLFYTLEQRVATFLLDETARTGGDIVALTQEKIAQAIGSAREAVTRTLKGLSASGAVEVSRGKIRILDRKALYEIVT